jgi:predicted amidohydrolase
MRVAVVQTNPVFGETASNVKDALAMMETVDADLYVLPELFNTGYNFVDQKEVDRLAENSSGQTFQILSGFSEKKSCYVVYGFAEKADRCYNSASLVGPTGLVGKYRKVHLYSRETLFFAPGNIGFPVFDLPFGKIGIMICFDWMFPESARSLALGGAQLIAHPSNLVMPYCPDAMVTRCLENRVFAATADRIGKEDRGGVKLQYIGKSEIVSPRGEILVRLDENEQGISVMNIDLEMASNKKINEYNDLLIDRKPGQYNIDL